MEREMCTLTDAVCVVDRDSEWTTRLESTTRVYFLVWDTLTSQRCEDDNTMIANERQSTRRTMFIDDSMTRHSDALLIVSYIHGR